MSEVHKSKLAQAIKVGLWGALAVYGAALLPLTAVAASEQTAASSGELEQLGRQLRGMVGRFSL